MTWSQVTIIVAGYLLGLYFQRQQITDFKQDMYRYIDAKFEGMEARFDLKLEQIKQRLDKLEAIAESRITQ